MSSLSSLLFSLVVGVVLLLFSLNTFVVEAAAIPGSWVLPERGPSGRMDFGFACTAKEDPWDETSMQLFLVGGYNADGPQYGLWSFDTEAFEWVRHFDDGFNEDQVGFELFASFDAWGEAELLVIGGRDYYTGDPVDHVQAYWWGVWDPIDPENYDDDEATPLASYWFGAWTSVDQFDTDTMSIFLWGGITEQGFSNRFGHIQYNASDGVSSALWMAPRIYSVGTAGTDSPRPRFGQCCAHDPSNAAFKAVCFGGTHGTDDTQDTWVVNYGGDIPYSQMWTKKSPTGTPPFWRRQAACGFVAPNRFVVIHGFDSWEGTATTDTESYILKTDTWEWVSVSNDASLKPTYGSKMTTCRYTNGTFRTFLFGGNQGDDKYSDALYTWDPVGLGFVKQPLNQFDFAGSSTPVGRAHHTGVAIRGSFFILNGIDSDENILNDIWEYNLLGQQWKRRVTKKSWTARWGASSALVGGLIYTYGGWNDVLLTTMSSDLVEIDPDNGDVVITSDYGVDAAPGGRAWHGTAVNNNVFIVAGGKNQEGKTNGKWFGYDIITQKWSKLGVFGNHTHKRHQNGGDLYRYGAVMVTLNTTHSLYGLGFAHNSKFDMHFVTNVSATAGWVTLTSIDTTDHTGTMRDYVRGFAGAVATANYLIVCGGVSTPGISPPKHAACFALDFLNQKWYVLGGSGEDDYILSAPAAIYLGRTLYLHGGFTSNGVAELRTANDALVKYVFDAPSMCPLGQTQGCVSCSVGTTNPGCNPAPKGYYSANPTKAPVACPNGTYLNSRGASSLSECIVCAYGTYNPSTAQSSCLTCPANHLCPIGADAAIAMTSPRAERLLHVPADALEIQPASFKAMSTPWFPIIVIISVMGLVFFILLFIVLLGRNSKNNRKRHYMTEDIENALQEAYKEHAKGKFGMSEADFMTVLITERGLALPEHDIDPDTAHRLYLNIDTYRTGYFLLEQFIDAVIVGIENGHMDPYPDTPACKKRKMNENWLTKLGKVKLEDLDFFEDQHAGIDCGESPRYFRTWYGGVVSLVFVVLVVGLILAVVLDFMINNHVETKSAVPRAVVANTFKDALQVHNRFSAEVTYFGLLRSSQGVNNLLDACLAKNTKSTCASASVTSKGFYTSGSDGDFGNGGANWNALPTTLHCSFDEREQSCTVSWTCTNCYVNEGYTGANLTFLVSPAMAAPIVRSEVTVGTGIHTPTQDFLGNMDVAGGPTVFSTVESFSRPTDNNSLYSGYPATKFEYGLTASYFEAENHDALFDSNSAFTDTGYHIRQSASPIPGSTVSPQLFDRKFDVPIILTFTVDATPVLVKRQLIRTLMDLITAMLGAMSGLSGVIVMVVQYIDDTGGNENHDEDDNELPDIAPDDTNNDLELADGGAGVVVPGAAAGKYEDKKGGGETEMKKKKQPEDAADDPFALPASLSKKGVTSAEDFTKLRRLMHSGMPLTQAEAIVRVIDHALHPEAHAGSPVIMEKRKSLADINSVLSGGGGGVMPRQSSGVNFSRENSINSGVRVDDVVEHHDAAAAGTLPHSAPTPRGDDAV